MTTQENGPWTVDECKNGVLVLQSDDFHHDAALEISGDFKTPEVKRRYAEEICNRLNAMNPVSRARSNVKVSGRPHLDTIKEN